MNERAKAQKLSKELLHSKLQNHGGEMMWRVGGDFGLMECWLIKGELRMVHYLAGNGGVNGYEPIRAESFDSLLEEIVPHG